MGIVQSAGSHLTAAASWLRLVECPDGRTFGSDLFDIRVQGLMGHASTATTAGYDRRPSSPAVKRLHFPYPTG